MYSIKTFNNIDPAGLERLPAQCAVSGDPVYDGIILRSFNLTDNEAVPSLCAVARAGAGVNNIPVDSYASKGIVVFNTPGANANAVKEIVVLGALLSARNVLDGVLWAQGLTGDVAKEVEAGKAAFTGPEILGKKVGVVGLGAVGVLVANIFDQLGAQVYGCDPFISIEHAWKLRSNVERVSDVQTLFETCDIVTIHVPYMEATKGFVDAKTLSAAKKGIRILNFARGELVNDEAMLEAIGSGQVASYVTDFPNASLINRKGVIAVPHLGASTPEAETNCAVMAAEQLADYLVNGNIVNSVNYPAASMGPLAAKTRLTFNHRNIPNMVGQITTILAEGSVNISAMQNASRGDFAYTMLEIDSPADEASLARLSGIEGVLRVRVLEPKAL